MEAKFEMTYPMWKRWQLWMEQNTTVNEAAEDPDSRYHRMAVAQKMSRKRLRGLIMAAGVSARDADDYLTRMNTQGYSYLECWNLNKHTMILKIKKRFEAAAGMALLRLIFDGDPPSEKPEELEAYRQKKAEEKKARYEADKALVEAHPEITSSREAQDARMKYLLSRCTQKEDGSKVLESKELDMAKFREYSRLSLWYSFVSWYIRHYGVPG